MEIASESESNSSGSLTLDTAMLPPAAHGLGAANMEVESNSSGSDLSVPLAAQGYVAALSALSPLAHGRVAAASAASAFLELESDRGSNSSGSLTLDSAVGLPVGASSRQEEATALSREEMALSREVAEEEGSDGGSDGPLDVAHIPESLAIVPLAADFNFSFTWASRLWVALKGLFGEDRLVARLFSRERSISTHFSGLGTAELAMAMLAAAGNRIMRARLGFRAAFACESSPACRAILLERLSGACVYKDILGRFQFDRSEYELDGNLEYAAARNRLWRTVPTPGSPCAAHGTVCVAPCVDGDVSGSPCTPWTRAAMASRKGRQHPCVVLLLAWCSWVRSAKPIVIVHENVVAFDVDVLEEMLGSLYWIQHLRVSPSHMGFPHIRRPRLYSVLNRRAGVLPPPQLALIYGQLVHCMRYATPADSHAWPWRAPMKDLLEEENATRHLRGLPSLAASSSDWSYLLTPPQAVRLQHFLQQASPSAPTAALICDLSQNPDFFSPSRLAFCQHFGGVVTDCGRLITGVG